MNPSIALEDAWSHLLDLVHPLPPEQVATEAALGRYLVDPLVAARTQPAADLSSMDGYALAGGGPWIVTGESRCGAPYAAALAPGQAARISTGSIIPDGADRVLIQEEAQRDGDRLALATALPERGAYIRSRGMDFTEGDTLLPAGTRLGPAQIALTLAAGQTTVAAFRAPRVAVLDCGDELVDGSTPATNGAMLASMLATLPCTVRRALEAWGAEIAFWRVAIRPGKPLLVAQRVETLVLGLPGNPVSAFVTGFLFVLPALRRMLGADEPLPRSEPQRCTADLPPGGDRGEFLRAIRTPEGIVPMMRRDSSLLAQLARADALILRPPECAGTKAGTDVPVYRLENGGIA